MIDRDRIHGGFNSSLRSQMSPQLQRKLSEQEDREARELAEQQRERALRAEQFQESAMQAAIQAALEAGETFHPRMLRGAGLGHTTSEFIALRAAEMDREDAQREFRRQVVIRKALAELEGQDYGDTSAHTIEAERAEKAAEREKRDRDLLQRGRQIQRNQTIRSARRLAAQDRREDRLLGR